VQTFSSDWTLREVRVMRILWTLGPSPKSPFSGFWKDMFVGLLRVECDGIENWEGAGGARHDLNCCGSVR
jgi:hypothetical protein